MSILGCTGDCSEPGSGYVLRSLPPSEIPLQHSASSEKAVAIERNRTGLDTFCRQGNICYWKAPRMAKFRNLQKKRNGKAFSIHKKRKLIISLEHLNHRYQLMQAIWILMYVLQSKRNSSVSSLASPTRRESNLIVAFLSCREYSQSHYYFKSSMVPVRTAV